MPRSVWKISAPARTASANDPAPSGMTMNSWKSTLLSAWAPPLRMFIIGTGSVTASAPPKACRCTARGGHRDRQDGVGAEAALVRRAVELDQAPVENRLIGDLVAHQGRSQHLVDVGDRARDPFAEVALGVAVAQLDRFMFAGRSAAGHRRATARARSQRQIAFHRGVAAGIKYLARRERSDGIHE